VKGKPQTSQGGCEQTIGDDDDDHAGLDALYQELGPGLVRYLRRLLHRSDLAEDIAQDAFLILVRKWPDVRNHPSPGAWLYTVARHLAFDTFRERSHEFLTEEPDQALARGIDPWDSHATQVAVREAVGKLPLRQREAVWLFYFCGFKQNEVAAIMQIQRNTVAALLFQARCRLAGLLGA
jgi:RNA polymerase sigma-70 factor (ECF subfamily)